MLSRIGAGEEPGVLEHHAEHAPHVIAVDLACVDSIDADAPLSIS